MNFLWVIFWLIADIDDAEAAAAGDVVERKVLQAEISIFLIKF
jgi:hypothetical protein